MVQEHLSSPTRSMALDMKHLFTLILLAPLALCAQYSDFYGRGTGSAQPLDSGEVRLTYATAKFGDLGRQNMKEEMDRINQEIESDVYKDKKDKDKAIAAAKMDLMVAKNPIKAHQYGSDKLLKYTIKHEGYGGMMLQGFLAYVEKAVLPHPSLFEFEEEKPLVNTAYNGVVTEIVSNWPSFNYRHYSVLDHIEVAEYNVRIEELKEIYANSEKPDKKNYESKEEYKKAKLRYEVICDSLDNSGAYLNMYDRVHLPDYVEGKMFERSEGDSVYLHQKQIEHRTVYGHSGYRTTLKWENDTLVCISDLYLVENNGSIFSIDVNYKGEKAIGLDFADLEGRRHYLSRFIDKHIATREILSEAHAGNHNGRPSRKSYKNPAEYQEAYDKWLKKITD